MRNLMNGVKNLFVGTVALAAFSVAATKTIDGYRARKEKDNPELFANTHNSCTTHHEGIYERHVKRPLDFACALLAAVALSPALMAIAAAVKIKLGSPVFFKQARPGKDGRLFDIYKFRTMTDARDAEGDLLPDSLRLSAFGKWLRSTSLDELPELLNILKGDMSIVGPRPLLARYLSLYNESQARRHEVRPGLTGAAQVRGRNLLAWEKRFAIDVDYVDNVTFMHDFEIVLKTVRKVLRREGISSHDSETVEEFGKKCDKDNDEKILLFFSLLHISSIEDRGIYTDLLREFRANGWLVCIIDLVEKVPEGNVLKREESCTIVTVEIGKIQKAGIIEKGINTLKLESRLVRAIDEYFSDVVFDLVLFPTPPITFVTAVNHVKRRDGAKSYLMLKDIFPQNSVDLGMLSTAGVKAPLYLFFRKKEESLYEASDFIGCMSDANVRYLLEHNARLDASVVEVCPNSIEPIDMSLGELERMALREEFGLPKDKTIFIYGGNLGRPQGIDHLIACVDSQRNNNGAFFLIVGSGTEAGAIEQYIKETQPSNVMYVSQLPKEKYDRLVGCCDVGMIFLDYRFTIPNYPSRLLSYMQAKLPVLAVTDNVSDVGEAISDGDFGWWCPSDDVDAFCEAVDEACSANLSLLGERAWEYLLNNYTAARVYEIISTHFCEEN